MTATEWLALAGITGTLAGTALGAWISWRIHSANLVHEERTRFHAQRLEVYAKYLAAVNAQVARFSVGAGWDLEQGAEILRQFGVLQLVATVPVTIAATDVHAVVHKIVSSAVTDRTALIQGFNSAAASVLTEMRKELGVGPIPQMQKSAA
jgi:ABC-type lipoprotein release transport system permease subunit